MKEKIKVFYLLNEEGRNKSIIEGGNGKELQCIEVEANEEILKFAQVSKEGKCILNVGFIMASERNKDLNEPILTGYEEKDDIYSLFINPIYEIKDFNRSMNIEELLIWEEKRVTNTFEIRDKYKDLLDKREENIKEYKKQKRLKYEENKKKETEECNNRIRLREMADKKFLENKKEREENKRDWIQEYGSQYLKDAIKLGYQVEERYATERCNIELAGFTLDYNYTSSHEFIDSPTEESIEMVKYLVEKGFDAEIRTLTRPPSSKDDDYSQLEDYFEKCEAIMIFDYLEEYTVVKECR